MRNILIVIILFTQVQLSAQSSILNNIIEKKQSRKSNLNIDDVSKGLKEALIISSKIAIKNASKINGFYNNNLIQIPFPQNAIQVKKILKKAGLEAQIKEFERSLNRAAEDATKKALDIFMQEIKNLSLDNAYGILKGEKNEATKYLKQKTHNSLYKAFFPIVTKSINQTGVTEYWLKLMKKYNKIPFVKKVNPNLNDYVTLKSIDGLFILMAIEEEKIRNNIKYRTTELLQKIF